MRFRFSGRLFAAPTRTVQFWKPFTASNVGAGIIWSSCFPINIQLVACHFSRGTKLIEEFSESDRSGGEKLIIRTGDLHNKRCASCRCIHPCRLCKTYRISKLQITAPALFPKRVGHKTTTGRGRSDSEFDFMTKCFVFVPSWRRIKGN